jgi:hypothetical protein
VLALDHHTGATLWNFDTGSPLVSARQRADLGHTFNVIPGSDGGLYTYHATKPMEAALEVSREGPGH